MNTNNAIYFLIEKFFLFYIFKFNTFNVKLYAIVFVTPEKQWKCAKHIFTTGKNSFNKMLSMKKFLTLGNRIKQNF